MSLLLPIFFLVVMATVDFGFAYQRYITVTNAAREGARVATINGATPASVEAAVRERLGQTLSDGSSVNVSPSPLGKSGSEVRVVVRYRYHFLTPLGGVLHLTSGSSEMVLSSGSSMRRE